MMREYFSAVNLAVRAVFEPTLVLFGLCVIWNGVMGGLRFSCISGSLKYLGGLSLLALFWRVAVQAGSQRYYILLACLWAVLTGMVWKGIKGEGGKDKLAAGGRLLLLCGVVGIVAGGMFNSLSGERKGNDILRVSSILRRLMEGAKRPGLYPFHKDSGRFFYYGRLYEFPLFQPEAGAGRSLAEYVDSAVLNCDRFYYVSGEEIAPKELSGFQQKYSWLESEKITTITGYRRKRFHIYEFRNSEAPWFGTADNGDVKNVLDDIPFYENFETPIRLPRRELRPDLAEPERDEQFFYSLSVFRSAVSETKLDWGFQVVSGEEALAGDFSLEHIADTDYQLRICAKLPEKRWNLQFLFAGDNGAFVDLLLYPENGPAPLRFRVATVLEDEKCKRTDFVLPEQLNGNTVKMILLHFRGRMKMDELRLGEVR